MRRIHRAQVLRSRGSDALVARAAGKRARYEASLWSGMMGGQEDRRLSTPALRCNQNDAIVEWSRPGTISSSANIDAKNGEQRTKVSSFCHYDRSAHGHTLECATQQASGQAGMRVCLGFEASGFPWWEFLSVQRHAFLYIVNIFL